MTRTVCTDETCNDTTRCPRVRDGRASNGTGVDSTAGGSSRSKLSRVFVSSSSSREMSTGNEGDGTRARTSGGARSTVEAMRDVLDAGRRARLCESAGSFTTRRIFESSRRGWWRRDDARCARWTRWAGRRRDGGGEEDENDENGSDTDGEAAFERVRDAIDARCDAVDAAVMVARGDEERLAGGRASRRRGGARDGARRRRGDLVAVRPQDSFEDVVDNRLENVHHLGLTKPVGYESYEAYCGAAANRPVDACRSFARGDAGDAADADGRRPRARGCGDARTVGGSG